MQPVCGNSQRFSSILAGGAVFGAHRDVRALPQAIGGQVERQRRLRPIRLSTIAGGSRRSHSRARQRGQRPFQRRGIVRASKPLARRMACLASMLVVW